MTAPIDAFPLTWPPGWRRTPAHQRTRARFNRKEAVYRDERQTDGSTRRVHAYDTGKEISIAMGVQRVLDSLERFGCDRDDPVISSNVPVTLAGVPRSDRRAPADPGVAVYWLDGKRARCIAVDRYDRVADNLAAIDATLEAMRAIERHGGAEILDRAFTGFAALPAPEQPWQTLGLETSRPTREQVNDAYRFLASKHHPDRGGDADKMARINAARDQLLEST